MEFRIQSLSQKGSFASCPEAQYLRVSTSTWLKRSQKWVEISHLLHRTKPLDSFNLVLWKENLSVPGSKTYFLLTPTGSSQPTYICLWVDQRRELIYQSTNMISGASNVQIPALFVEVLSAYLLELIKYSQNTLLQYVDDILISLTIEDAVRYREPLRNPPSHGIQNISQKGSTISSLDHIPRL